MKKVKSIILALILLGFSVPIAQAEEISRREFLDTLIKIMGISEQVSRDIAGFSGEEIFDFETAYLWRNYASESLRGLSGTGNLKLGEFVDVIYHYLLNQDLELNKNAGTFKEMLSVLTGLGIDFSQDSSNDVMDKEEVLRILNSPLFANLIAEAYHSPPPRRDDVLGGEGTEGDAWSHYATRDLADDGDYDNDGVSDLLEIARGTDYMNADTDGDGIDDLADNAYGWQSALDANNDGISDKREGWGWELAPDKEQITDLEKVSDSFFEIVCPNGTANLLSRVEKLIWDAIENNGVNDIPAGYDRATVRQLVKEQLRDDINDITKNNRFRKFDSTAAKIADAQAGKVLTDIHGNRVRVDQYILRPDSDTVQLLNITLRSGDATTSGGVVNIGGVSTLEWKIDFNKSLDSLASGKLKDLPWDVYLTLHPEYVSKPDYYPQNSTITLARNNSSVSENRTFTALTQSGNIWVQSNPDKNLSLDINGTGVGPYSYSSPAYAGFTPDSEGWLWIYVNPSDGTEVNLGVYNIDGNGGIVSIPNSGDNINDMHSALRYSLYVPAGYVEWYCKFGNGALGFHNADVVTMPMSGFDWNDISYSE